MIRSFINSGSEIAGSAIGGALGFLAGGPLGAAAGSAVGAGAATALKKIGNDVSERFLSEREKVRAGGVLAIAANDIQQRIAAGESIRDDGFFESRSNARSGAEEIAESVLLKAQTEPEEKKIQFLGRLLSAISFDANVSPELGHQVIKIAEQLTYRQLCILNLCAFKQYHQLKSTNYRGQASFSRELYQVLYECHDLYVRGLINIGGEVAFGPTDIVPAQMTIQGIGADLFNLMGLVNVIPTDVTRVVSVLR
ncbi:TPA: hypothetical protein I7784_22825 [Vibrio vulnificus]|nr:hypothetical protein D8T23_17080 [Vibrio vulnificus]HAS8623086.1 hypothetical protein [Vibrio vulnificus]